MMYFINTIRNFSINILLPVMKTKDVGRIRYAESKSCKFSVHSVDRPCRPCEVDSAIMAAVFKPVTHIIFDLDGLLLDTEPVYYRAQLNILKRFGKEYTDEVRHKILGTIEPDTGRIFVEELNLPITPEEFIQMQTEEISTGMPNVPLMPGAERLIRHFHSHGIPMAVATSSSRQHVELKLKNYKSLFSVMHHIVSGTSDPEVEKGKPAPDVFLVCASKFDGKPIPEKVLVFEDAPNGVVAACAAGMQVVMVPEPHVPMEKRLKATAVIPSLLEFQPQLFSLPPFND